MHSKSVFFTFSLLISAISLAGESQEILPGVHVGTELAGTKIMSLSLTTAQEIFAHATKTKLGGVMTSERTEGKVQMKYLECLQNTSPVCCRKRIVVAATIEAGSEKCLIAVNEDGTLANLDVSFDK